MAHLPPKIPRCNSNSNSNWPPSSSPSPNPNPSWVDEFLDFASARRGSHRRSISDSIAFLEQSPDDGFEDDHFISMFAEPTAIEQTARNEEVESDCLCQWQLQGDSSSDRKVDVDPKRVKRILANRQSAQRSRVRKLQYISELERSVTSLQAQVSVLSPRVAFLDHQRLLLNVDNSFLKQRIAALAQDRIFRDAREGALRREIERLRRVYEVKDKSKNMNTERTSAGVGVAEQEQGQEHPHQLLDAST